MTAKLYTGINIQFPISRLIIEGKKIIETRTYPIPAQYLNQEMLLIETPGKNGKFKARIIAIIKFTSCYQYKTKTQFYEDIEKHCVGPDSSWAWKTGEKWGWEVKVVKKIKHPIDYLGKKGIKYTKNIRLIELQKNSSV